MRIGIYGGTFNPVHIGHLHVADVAARALCLDRVIFVPTGNSYMKSDTDMASGWCRLMMINFACQNDDRFFVSKVDLQREGPTYTIDTMRDMKALYPHDKLFFIIGADSLEQLPKWKNIEELIKEVSFIVIGRKGIKMEIPKPIKQMKDYDIFIIRDAIKLDVSSSEIREAIKRGKSCKYLLPPNVYEYILEHKLYKDWELLERMTKGV